MADRQRAEHAFLDALRVWGDALVAYVCGVSREQVEAWQDTFTAIPEQPAEVCRFLARHGQGLVVSASGEPPRIFETAERAALLAVDIEGRSAVNALRELSGAVPLSSASDDELVGALRAIGRDLLPVYLTLVAQTGGPDTGAEDELWQRAPLFSLPFAEHPQHDAFVAALERDDALKPLRATFETPHSLLAGHSISGTGGGYLISEALGAQHLYRPTLAADLLEAAWDRAHAHNPPFAAGVQQALDEVREVVDDLRSAVAGDAVTLKVTIGIRGLAFEAGQPAIEVGNLSLRGVSLAEAKRTGPEDPLGAVLELDLDDRFAASANAEVAPIVLPQLRTEPWATLVGRFERVALAVSLAFDEIPPATLAWVAIHRPAGPAAIVYSPARFDGASELIEADAVPVVASRVAAVDAAAEHLDGQEIRRSLSAMHERGQFADAVVDVAIVLESLLTTKRQGSMVVRLACAWLLHPDDPDGRAATFEEVRQFYRWRNGAAHAGSPVTHEQRQRAISLLRAVWRALLERPDLVADPQRGSSLALDLQDGGGST